MTTQTPVNREENRELLEACRECLAAASAAMRVIADLDMAHAIGWAADTKQQRFIDELHFAGVKDGFGVRAQAAIAKAEGC
jgi:hypothetical protein